MTRYAESLLGPSPHSLDSAMAGLARLEHLYAQDDDAETRQSNGIHANRVTDARLAMLHSLIAWLAPAVEAERAEWDRLDRIDAQAKEARWPG